MNKSRTVRRSLLRALVLCATSSVVAGQSNAAEVADSIFYNGKFITADSKFSIAEAVAVKNGRFMAVGKSSEIRKLTGPATEARDLHGMTVIPGLMDAHTHMDGAGERELVVQLSGTKSVADAQERIREFVARTPNGIWIRSSSWHPPSQLKEQRYLTRQEIDAAAPDNPAFFQTVGHFAMANTKALEIAGITKDTPDPVGGKIYRDDAGNPTGVLEEKAMGLVETKVPALTEEQMIARNIAAQRVYNSYGVTSLVVAGLNEQMIHIYQQVAKEQHATIRSAVMWRPPINDAKTFRDAVEKTAMKDNTGDEWVKLAGIKISIDGGMTLKTAFTRSPYLDNPAYRGTVSVDPAAYKASVMVAHDHGWRVGTHAVGDAAVDMVLDAYDAIKRDGPTLDRGFSVIHGSLINPDQIDRAKRMGVRVDSQNVFLWDKASTVERLMGAAIAKRAVPTKMLLDKLGYSLTAAGTDSQTNIINPYVNMYIMVTRKDPNGVIYGQGQAISREQALRLYTNAGPYITFDENQKGSIEVGKLADMVVLSADYLTVPDEEIKNLKAMQTIVGGKAVYDAQQDSVAAGTHGV